MNAVETVFLNQWARETVQMFQERLAITDFLNVFGQQEAQQQMEQEREFQNLETLWSEWMQLARDFERVSFPEDLKVALDADSNNKQDVNGVRPLAPLASPNPWAEMKTTFSTPASRQRETVKREPSPFLRRVPTIMPSVTAPVNELWTNPWVTPSLAKTQERTSFPTAMHFESPFSNVELDALPHTHTQDFEQMDTPASTREIAAFPITPLTVKPLVHLDDAETQAFEFPVVREDVEWESSKTKSPPAPLSAAQTPQLEAKNRAERVEPSLDAPKIDAKMPSSVLRRILPTPLNALPSKNPNVQERFDDVQRSTYPIVESEANGWNSSKSPNLPTNPITPSKTPLQSSFPEIRNPKSKIRMEADVSSEQTLEQVGVENKAIWQKPLGNLSNFAAFAHVAVESEGFDDFFPIAEKTMMPLEASHSDSKKIQKTSFSTFEEGTVAPLAIFEQKTVAPLATFEQISVSPDAPLPQVTPQRIEAESSFFQKTTEEVTSPLQTEILLEALTQRIAQEYKRFYPE